MTLSSLLLVASLAAPPSPTDVLNRVQAAYRKAGDLEGRFSQTYVDKLRGKRREESGRIWAKQDGRLRWSYDKPTPKDFVYDGKSAYFYEPDNAQVTVFERFQDSPLSSAVRFLWGQGNIAELFDVEACSGACEAGDKGDWVIALRPKSEIPTIDHTLLAVDPATDRVRVSVIYDPLGNRTEYRFTELKTGATIPDAKFQFDVPKGVSVLRAGSEGEPPPPAAATGDKKPQPKSGK